MGLGRTHNARGSLFWPTVAVLLPFRDLLLLDMFSLMQVGASFGHLAQKLTFSLLVACHPYSGQRTFRA